jgi:glycosyltransferase involved in cell wall biosynthesis
MVLKSMDRLLSKCATSILIDSHAQMEFLLRQNVVKPAKASVLANGSIQGVDTNRFQPRQDVRDATRANLHIPPEATVFAYVGRLKRDKGVLDLAVAFSQLCAVEKGAYLVVVGHDEENLSPEIESLCSGCAGMIRIVGPTSDPEDYLAAADVLCLPSYREGFPCVVIEAAACEVPTLASRIYGISDTMREDVTGLFHKAGDIKDLVSGMLLMAQDRERRIQMGKRARARAIADFSREKVIAALLQYYQRELSHQQWDDRVRFPSSHFDKRK